MHFFKILIRSCFEDILYIFYNFLLLLYLGYIYKDNTIITSMSISSLDSENGSGHGDFECECGHKYNHAPSLSRHKKTCKFLIQKQQQDLTMKAQEELLSKTQQEKDEMMKMMSAMNNNMMTMMMTMMKSQQAPAPIVVEKKKQKKEKPKFSAKEYLKKCKDVLFWKAFARNKKFTMEEYDTIYNSGAIEGTKRIINNWLSGLDKKQLPFVVTNSQKTRFTIYCKEETEWKKYEGETGYEKVLSFIEIMSFRMLLAENSNIIYDRYPLAASNHNSYRPEAREQQQIKIQMLGSIASVAEYTRDIAKDIISNFIVDKEDSDDESISDVSSDESDDE